MVILGGKQVKIDPLAVPPEKKSWQVVKDGVCVPDTKTYTVGPRRACFKKWSLSDQRVVLQSDGSMDKRMDGWMDGWMDRSMDR